MTKRVETIDLVQDRPWAIYPAKLDDVNAAILARLNGEPPAAGFKIAAPEGDSDGPRYEVKDGVAVVPVWGTLFKRANLFMEISGGTSYDLLRADIAEAMERRDVDAVLLDVDSPGGTVDGVFELATWLRSLRGTKPVVAYADGLMASAAYALGAQADKVLVAASALVGSIGVISMHYDRSGEDQKWGIRRTAIAAGAFKAAGSDHKPLEAEDHAYLQGIVDDYYALFVAEVSAARPGLTPDAVRATEARVYVGAKAVDTGLADAVATYEEAIAMAREMGTMDKKDLQAKHPDTYQAVFEDGRAAALAETKDAPAQAVAAERTRCAKIVGFQGAHDATLKAISEGTEPGAFAEAVLAAERAGRAEASAGIAEGLDQAAAAAGKETEKPGTSPAAADFDAKVEEHLKANPNTKRSAAVAAMARAHPQAHEAWLAAKAK